MVNIAVVGSTGPTGVEVIKESLSRGWSVKAVLRDPAKLSLQDSHLEVTVWTRRSYPEGLLTHRVIFQLPFMFLNAQVHSPSIFKKDELAEVFRGCDAVVSCLGSRSMMSQVTVYSESIVSITDAMREADVSKLVVMSSAMCKGKNHYLFSIELATVFHVIMCINP